MTSYGSCHRCGAQAFSFHYLTKRENTFAAHDGYWHCNLHGPDSFRNHDQGTANPLGVVEYKDPMHGMNRAERRAFKKKKKERC